MFELVKNIIFMFYIIYYSSVFLFLFFYVIDSEYKYLHHLGNLE